MKNLRLTKARKTALIGNAFHPVADWVLKAPWDGSDRIGDLTRSLNPVDPVQAEMLLKKWLMAAITGAFDWSKGVSAQGMLILQGPQATGKSRWAESLVGERKDFFLQGHSILPGIKDTEILALKYWIVELGEISTSAKANDAMKAFITKSFDEIRAPYAAEAAQMPRQTVFIGTTNKKVYLTDETGNRRYFTIPIKGTIDWSHGIDMQQVWSQVYYHYENRTAGWTTWLDESQLKQLESTNSKHTYDGIIGDRLRTYYQLNTNFQHGERNRILTVSDILRELEFPDNLHYDTRPVAVILEKALGVDGPEYSESGMRGYRMPIRLSDEQRKDCSRGLQVVR